MRTLRSWLAPYVYLSNNWMSLTGVVLVTTAAVLWLFLLPVMITEHVDNPYLNILTVMILPVPFFLGLILIPLGEFIRFRTEKRAGRFPGGMPSIELGS